MAKGFAATAPNPFYTSPECFAQLLLCLIRLSGEKPVKDHLRPGLLLHRKLAGLLIAIADLGVVIRLSLAGNVCLLLICGLLVKLALQADHIVIFIGGNKI